MNFSSIKQKVREIDWKGVFLSRNFIIVCCVMLVAAGILVFSVAGGKTDTVSQSGTKVLGNAVLVGSEVADGADAEDASARAIPRCRRSKRSPIRPTRCPTPGKRRCVR